MVAAVVDDDVGTCTELLAPSPRQCLSFVHGSRAMRFLLPCLPLLLLHVCCAAASQEACSGGSCAFSRALHVVTVAADAKHTQLLRAVAHASQLGVQLRVLEEDGSSKLRRVSAFLDTLPASDDGSVLLYVDAYDSLVTGTSNQLLDAYDEALVAYSATPGGVMFAAERSCRPDAGLAGLYPPHGTHPGSPYKYLDIGAYAGSVSALRALFADLGAAAAAADVDEQRLLSTYYMLSRARAGAPVVTLDAGSRLFMSLASSTIDVTLQPDGAVTNTVVNTRPLVFHAHGSSERFLWDELAPRPQEQPGASAAKEPPPFPPGMRLYIATPMYGGMAHGSYILAVLELVALLRTHGIQAEYDVVMQESLITRARNNLAASFLGRKECTHLLFIDADVGFNAEDVLLMLRAGKELSGGAYAKKGINWHNVAAAARAHPDLAPEELHRLLGFYVINFLPGTKTIHLDEPTEVQDLGTGLMLIQRSVLERLAEAYPERRYKAESDKTVTAFFDTMIDAGGQYLSEDFLFCQLWRAIGGKVWLCPWVRTTHAGTYAFRGDLRAISTRLPDLFGTAKVRDAETRTDLLVW